MMMNIQVLIATMNQNDHSLLNKMNIQSDAIVANQSNYNQIENFIYKGHKIKYLTFNEIGVGLNRNNALMRATNEISIIADDDLIYVDDYVDIVKKSFTENPTADVIIFNLNESKQERYIIKKKFKVGFNNYMRFGAARIAFRTKSITKSGITFNLHFGGGAEYSAGEDVLFLNDCLRKGLKIIAVPVSIACLTETRKSTWFNGYTDKFFIDKGFLFASISKRWAWFLSLQFCLRRRKMFKNDKSWMEAFKLMLIGVKENKKRN